MAAPSQEFPPWLTQSITVITDAAGAPVTTSTTVLYLPLTYYGPSIPLNSDWTYGGLFPPSTTTTATTTLPTSLTTASPPSSTSSQQTSATPSSSPTSQTTSFPTTSVTTASTSTSSPSSSPSPTVVPAATVGRNLTKGQLAGVVVAGVLGLVFLCVLSLCLFLWCRGRRARTPIGEDAPRSPISQNYEFVDQHDENTLGHDSSNHSRADADLFIREDSSVPGAQPQASTSNTIPRVPVPPTGSLSSSGKSSSTNSGYGVLLERPTLNVLPPMREERMQLEGKILSPQELKQMDEEYVLPREDFNALAQDYSPLMPPPRITEPEFGQIRIVSHVSDRSHRSSFPADAEEAALLTAQRVRIGDLGSRTKSQGDDPYTPLLPRAHARARSRHPSNASRTSRFLEGIASISRMSWFNKPHSESHSYDRSLQSSFIVEPYTDDDLEAGRARPEMSENRNSRASGTLGVPLTNSAGSRASNITGTSSGPSVYFDAQTSLPSTPRLTPLPRALTPLGHHQNGSQDFSPWNTTPTGPGVAAVGIREARLVDISPTNSPEGGHAVLLRSPPPVLIDLLDTPVPPPLTSFGSTNSMSNNSTVSSTVVGAPRSLLFPPGLSYFPTPKAWAETSTMAGTLSQRSRSFAADSNVSAGSGSAGIGITVDLLEEEPPAPGQNWKMLASYTGSDQLRRSTFGPPQLVTSPDVFSEQGSLHSMRSQFEPPPSGAIGSAPASSRRVATGSSGLSASNSSASSKAFSAARSIYSSSLSHSGSISSDGRRRLRGHMDQYPGSNGTVLTTNGPEGPISPSLSAFGQIGREGSSNSRGRPATSLWSHERSPSGGRESSSPGMVLMAQHGARPSSPPSEYSPTHSSPLAELMPAHVQGRAMLSPNVTGVTPLSPVSLMTDLMDSPPWAGGLDNDWAAS